ncbi:lasso peptide biosynthesis PqqD family chaperone [uncultured Clostridium sp.]|uniref:lasso peptide biosynthesis PqqD family chaperone n=1 Tax=uncultured Clostridium sp. TaxID=59620 RepID=UPI0025D6F1D8|nr:lasso peptide biosynthesis PqqD family chaperone [uncultured Clostridium sp.]
MKRNIKSNIEIKLDLNSVIIRNGNVDDTDIDGEKVMMNIERGQYYSMNEPAGVIWDMAEKEIAVEDIVNKLLEEYEVEKDICISSTLSFLERLYYEGLIKTA